MLFVLIFLPYPYINYSYFLVFTEGGVDPANQGAQLEDRFYNNKAFEVSNYFLLPVS